MKLSVVVGTYNRRDQIRACLESIAAETRTPHVVYVTDAGSTDGTIEYLQSVASDVVKPIFVGKRLGQARAYNDVFDMVDTPYVVWLSDDNVIVNQGLDKAVRSLEIDHSLGMVGLKVRDVEGPFVDAPYVGGISSIGVLTVNQGMLRTEVLREVGGFSEAFRDYGIDPDLTAKVLFAGYDVALTRAVAVHHHRNWDADASSPQHRRLRELQDQYMSKYSRKYAALAERAPVWRARKQAWAWLQAMWPKRLYINAAAPMLGRPVRDLYNVVNGRYISLADPILSWGRPYHLIQRCLPWDLPPAMPTDPPPLDNEIVHVR